MTDKKTAPTEEDRRLARKWAESMSPDINGSDTALSIARVILDAVPPPARPTLADMTPEERRACDWTQADVRGEDGTWLVLDSFYDEDRAHVVNRRGYNNLFPASLVTPRPDLARMEWTGNHAPALPEGWRLANHPEHGLVVVTSTTPDCLGRVSFVAPAPGTVGNDWHICKPTELTYIDTASDVPESTLAVGSEWGDADALARACEETGRDQIVILDSTGDAYVWDKEAEWWEGSAPPRFSPFTIIHAGRKADQ